MELNIKLWRDEANRAIVETKRLKKIMDDDPTTMLLECHTQFNELLKKYQGKERLTPQFKVEVDKLSRKEKRAKTIQKSYDMMKAMDDYHEAKMREGNIITELHTQEFYYKLKHEDNKDKREAMIVKDVLDKVRDDI